MRIGAAFLLALATAGPAGSAGLYVPCARGDRACALTAGQAHVVKRMAYWQPRFAQPVEERVANAPPELVQFLMLDVIHQGLPNEPHVPADHPEILVDIKAALADLPTAVRRRLSDRLAGIYLVEDIGGTGFTDTVADAEGHKVAAFVVLDPNILEKRTANAWATWKESSPFIPDSRHALAATLESARDDNRRQAIQYILLHELGHVLSVAADFHPDWNLAPRYARGPGSYPFFDISWMVDMVENRYVNLFAVALPEIRDVVYYFGPKLPASRMVATYEHLGQTSFPTLYAATLPGDDFAESFANYVHVVLMGKPFEIAILEDGKVVKSYGPCWNEPRCAGKRRILEDFLR